MHVKILHGKKIDNYADVANNVKHKMKRKISNEVLTEVKSPIVIYEL